MTTSGDVPDPGPEPVRPAEQPLTLDNIATMEAKGDVQGLVTALGRAVQVGEWGVSEAARDAIARIGDPTAGEYLALALCDPDSQVRRSAAEMLSRLAESSHTIYEAAAKALCRADDRRSRKAIQSLGRRTRDPDGWVSEAAVQVLAWVDGPQVIEPLLAARGGKSAAGALRKFERSQPIEPVLAALHRLLHGGSYVGAHADASVREGAAEMLGRIGNPQSTDVLAAVLRDASDGVRRAAAIALGRPGNAAAVAPLVAVLRDASHQVRQAAASALGNIGAPEAIAALVPLLEDPVHEVRAAAADALGKLGWEPATPEQAAIRAVAAQQWEAATAFGHAALKPLTAALSEDGVGYAAARALAAKGTDPVPLFLAAVRSRPMSSGQAQMLVSMAREGAGRPDSAALVEPLVAALRALGHDAQGKCYGPWLGPRTQDALQGGTMPREATAEAAAAITAIAVLEQILAGPAMEQVDADLLRTMSALELNADLIQEPAPYDLQDFYLVEASLDLHLIQDLARLELQRRAAAPPLGDPLA